MTAYPKTSLCCDAPRCRATFPANRKPMDGDWGWVREKAAEAGWTYSTIRRPAGDLCPEHSGDTKSQVQQ